MSQSKSPSLSRKGRAINACERAAKAAQAGISGAQDLVRATEAELNAACQAELVELAGELNAEREADEAITRSQAKAREQIEAALIRHQNVALQFSGGKDSLCCLHLLQPYWSRILVVWVNPGAPFPETQNQMSAIRRIVPHFLEVKGNQPAQVALQGFPVDILPARNSFVGRSIHPDSNDVKLQSFIDCCWQNFWRPAQEEMKKRGITLLIRGQRLAERKRAPISSGFVANEVEHLFPIEDWTNRQVTDYMEKNHVAIPAYYQTTGKSLDCWSCTAYLDESAGRLKYTREAHPELWPELRRRLRLIRDAVRDEVQALEPAAAEIEK